MWAFSLAKLLINSILYFLSIINLHMEEQENKRATYILENWTKKYPSDNLHGISHKIAYLIWRDMFGIDNHIIDYAEGWCDTHGDSKLYYKWIAGPQIPRIYHKGTEMKWSFVRVKISDNAWSVTCKIQKDLCNELWKRLKTNNLKIENKINSTPSNRSTNSL